MTTKDLIKELLNYPMDSEVYLSLDEEHDDGDGGKCNGYLFEIERLERFNDKCLLSFTDYRKN